MTINFKEGILIPIDKPYGVTSFKALAHIRYLCSHALGGKVKMGHAGTLDPLATGVLVGDDRELRHGAPGQRYLPHGAYHPRADS